MDGWTADKVDISCGASYIVYVCVEFKRDSNSYGTKRMQQEEPEDYRILMRNRRE